MHGIVLLQMLFYMFVIFNSQTKYEIKQDISNKSLFLENT